jgi:N4-gp56 family major capsid protein
MARTIVGLNDPKAVKKYSAFLAVDVGRKSYFNKKFMGKGVEAQTPLQMLTSLENDAGDTVSYDLVMQLRMQPVEGDNTLEGKEEDLKFYSDSVVIDQARGGVNTGGRMTRKRTIHDLRKVARARQSDWWGRIFDELFFLYLSGGFRDSGTGACDFDNGDYTYPSGYVGFASNTFVAPDSQHRAYGGDATSFATLDANDKLTLSVIDKLVTKASTLGGGTTGIPSIEPIMIDGEEHYVMVMHPFQEYDLRTNTNTGQWLDIQKAAASAEGRNNPIFKGGLGKYNDVVLHKHRSVLLRNDGGAGAVAVARALFLGRQAGVVSFGSPGTGLRFDWNEESRDNGNQAVITTSSIFGVKKAAFTIEGVSRDFGVMAIDTAAANPAP